MLEERIAAYLATKLATSQPITVQNVFRIPGGQSRETWSFDASWEDGVKAVTRGFIMRRDPDASLLESDRHLEFGVMQAVRPLGIPVPEMYWLEEDASLIERPFCMMERIDECETSPTTVLMDPRFYPVRGQIAAEFAGILGRIHRVDWKSLGLDVLGNAPPADECGEREIERWEAIVAQEALEPQPVLRASFRWMRRNLPRPPREIVLVHADYRTGNFLAHPSGEIRGILDWEMTHLGDPMEDVGWACIRPWRWLGNEQVGGLMERSDFYRMYEESAGIQIDEEAVRFWEVLGNAKLAAIFLTGGRSYCEGRTKSTMMAFIARNVRRLELEILDLMGV